LVRGREIRRNEWGVVVGWRSKKGWTPRTRVHEKNGGIDRMVKAAERSLKRVSGREARNNVAKELGPAQL